MSWQDKLENNIFKIKTGDGKVYLPLWKNGQKEKRFNYTAYNFINVNGTFVDRKMPESSRHPLLFWFQGEDNIEQAAEFEESANDPRPWTIEHPFYGTLYGQPVSLKIVDTSYNVTEISVDFFESISSDYPDEVLASAKSIQLKTNQVNTSAANNIAAKIKAPTTLDQRSYVDSVTQVSASFNKFLDSENYNEFENALISSSEKASMFVTDVKSSSVAYSNMLLVPSNFTASILDRIKAYEDAYERTFSIFNNSNNLNKSEIFETNALYIVSSVCNCISNPIPSDFKTRNEIAIISEKILSMYTSYLSLINSNEVRQVTNSYSPNPVSQTELSQLVYETLSNLFSLAFSAQQERIIELKKDSNVILLCHEYFGLSDENLETFRELNNIKSRKLFMLEAGTEIKYFA